MFALLVVRNRRNKYPLLRRAAKVSRKFAILIRPAVDGVAGKPQL